MTTASNAMIVRIGTAVVSPAIFFAARRPGPRAAALAGLVLLDIITLNRRRWRQAGGPPWANAAREGTRSAEATRAQRFAEGDIEEAEYRARLEVLRANRLEAGNG